MRMPDYFIIFAVVISFVSAVIYMVKRKKRGRCCGCCSSCVGGTKSDPCKDRGKVGK